LIINTFLDVSKQEPVHEPRRGGEETKGSPAYKRDKYLKSLSKLNVLKVKMPNPENGKEMLIFGPVHIYMLVNNFSIPDQDKQISACKRRLKRANEIEQMREKNELLNVKSLQMVKKAREMKLPTSEIEAKIESLMNDMKYVDKRAKEQQKKAISEVKEIKHEDLRDMQNDDQKHQYSCHALFYRIIDELDDGEYKKTIKHDEIRYRQIFAGYGNVRGDIMKFNEKRLDVTEERWNHLTKILRTDEGFKKALIPKEGYDIDAIIIKDTVKQQRSKKKYKPLSRRLFSEESSNAIYHKDVSFNLNRKGETFRDLFKVRFGQYVQDNYKANSCFLNSIVDKFHDGFEARKADGKRKCKPLTYDLVCQIIGLKNTNQDVGITIRQSEVFFKKYSLGLDVINEFGELIFSCQPPKLNSNIRPQVLRLLIHNSHCQTLDATAKAKIEKLRVLYKQKKTQFTEASTLQVSDQYRLRKPVLDAFIDKLEECVKIVRESEMNTKLRFVTNTPLLLFEMLANSYTPHISFCASRIMSLGFKVGKVAASIGTSNPSAPEDSLMFLEKDEYEEYHRASDLFYQSILKELYRSIP